MVDIRKLSVGDQVMIRPDLSMYNDYDGVCVVGVMEDHRLEIMTVSEIQLDCEDFSDYPVDIVRLQEDENYCGWTSSMLEPVNNVSLMDMLAENNI